MVISLKQLKAKYFNDTFDLETFKDNIERWESGASDVHHGNDKKILRSACFAGAGSIMPNQDNKSKVYWLLFDLNPPEPNNIFPAKFTNNLYNMSIIDDLCKIFNSVENPIYKMYWHAIEDTRTGIVVFKMDRYYLAKRNYPKTSSTTRPFIAIIYVACIVRLLGREFLRRSYDYLPKGFSYSPLKEITTVKELLLCWTLSSTTTGNRSHNVADFVEGKNLIKYYVNDYSVAWKSTIKKSEDIDIESIYEQYDTFFDVIKTFISKDRWIEGYNRIPNHWRSEWFDKAYKIYKKEN